MEKLTLSEIDRRLNSFLEDRKGFMALSLIAKLERMGNQKHLIKSIKKKGLPKECYYSKDMEILALTLCSQGGTNLKLHNLLPENSILFSWGRNYLDDDPRNMIVRFDNDASNQQGDTSFTMQLNLNTGTIEDTYFSKKLDENTELRMPGKK